MDFFCYLSDQMTFLLHSFASLLVLLTSCKPSSSLSAILLKALAEYILRLIYHHGESYRGHCDESYEYHCVRCDESYQYDGVHPSPDIITVNLVNIFMVNLII